jgi:hypothetical protein
MPPKANEALKPQLNLQNEVHINSKDYKIWRYTIRAILQRNEFASDSNATHAHFSQLPQTQRHRTHVA